MRHLMVSVMLFLIFILWSLGIYVLSHFEGNKIDLWVNNASIAIAVAWTAVSIIFTFILFSYFNNNDNTTEKK